MDVQDKDKEVWKEVRHVRDKLNEHEYQNYTELDKLKKQVTENGVKMKIIIAALMFLVTTAISWILGWDK